VTASHRDQAVPITFFTFSPRHSGNPAYLVFSDPIGLLIIEHSLK
jgi:hypothetical protein